MWHSWSSCKLPPSSPGVLGRLSGEGRNNFLPVPIRGQPPNRLLTIPQGYRSGSGLIPSSVAPRVIHHPIAPGVHAMERQDKYTEYLRLSPPKWYSGSYGFHSTQGKLTSNTILPDRLRGLGETSTHQGPLEQANYQVFLSFRGPDARQGFVDCLYHFLVDAGIRVFKDDEDNPLGAKIAEILEAIEDSVICIPIFSRNYASSKWCLRELARMIELNKKIIPIFYDATPDDVSLKTSLYVDALEALRVKMEGREYAPNEKIMISEEMEQWEKALRVVGSFTGRELKGTGYGEFSKFLVKKVLDVLKVNEKIVTDHLVGMDNYVETMLNRLDVEAQDVRYIGIYGMGGIGKTTLAKVIFNRLAPHFEYCCFLSDTRESSQRKGIEYMQNKLLNDLRCKSAYISDCDEGIKTIRATCRNKKVLIVLDDVDKSEQIEKLAGNSNWFALGSRIVVTSRDTSVLAFKESTLENVSTLEMMEMNFDHALQLFSRHAFGTGVPSQEYYFLARSAVSVSGFLPLSLEIIGSLLGRTHKDDWDKKIRALGRIPHKSVQEKLKISYEALDHHAKQMFLDIACFLMDMEKANAIYMWEACNYHPEAGVEDLVSRSLVKIVNNRFWMHDHIRDMGRDIVYSEDIMHPGKRSRLWKDEDVLGILERREEAEKVGSLCLSNDMVLKSRSLQDWKDARGRDMDDLESFSEEWKLQLSEYHEIREILGDSKNFKNLKNLMFLKLGDKSLNLSGDFEGLLPNLRWLSWHGCPSELTARNLNLANLVILELSGFGITEDWNGWSEIKIGDNLKVLNLSYCPHLGRTPDLSRCGSLEKLILECCMSLTQLDSSFRMLKTLKHLNLKLCLSLPGLPEEVCSLENLEEILVQGDMCSFSLPRGIGDMKSLVNLELVGLAMTELPAFICRHKRLKRLSLAGCLEIDKLPDSLGDMKSLVELDISRTGIRELPASICRLKKLERLSLVSCQVIRKLPDSLGDLQSLVELDVSGTGIRELPESVGSLRKLKVTGLKI